ncbi:hypothetical protein QUF95_15615 [Paenibacillus silvae]|uniref:hypothetical protein n=1 Tax=Paenibacillus silvae TaxID=1325358 RepID=UPI0025A04635|nr:hypothetical protein [Paenibacillus silvae]MDM5278826.1 hypothetical protein [Paenibacillus silvae]
MDINDYLREVFSSRTNAEQMDEYIKEIKRLRKEATQYDEDSPGGMIEIIRLLTEAHTLMGRVSAQKEGDYAKIHVVRDNVDAEARATAKRGEKEVAAARATAELRMIEADALEQKAYWKNELNSVKEKIYELRLRVRIEMHITGGGVHG